MVYIRNIAKAVNTTVLNVEAGFIDTSRICISNSEEIKNNLIDIVSQPHTHLTLNLEEVVFIDSTAFRVLNSLNQVARKHNSSISLSNVNNAVMELINLVKKYSVFNIEIIRPQQVKVA